MPTARGSFEVTLTPQPDDSPVGRRLIDKHFTGDLTGTSAGQMLAMASPSGSAAYVAMEQVTGTLAGHEGTFGLVHRGTMRQGQGELLVTVVPDSGTGDLSGLTGSMTIDIVDGVHHYVFDWLLPT